MNMSFRVTLWAGKRTKTAVDAYSTAVNKRTVVLKNGKKLSDAEVARYLKNILLEAVKKLENEQVIE